MRRTQLCITALAITATLLFSCALPAADNSAGSYQSGTQNIAAYWVEGNRTDLCFGTAYAKSIYVAHGIK